jgi:TP901 family phage tail tape measure protein
VANQLVVQITGDASQLNRVLGQSESRLGRFAKAGGVAGLALTAGLGMAVKSAADFEAQLDSLAAVSDANATQMERMAKQAKDAGAATKFSALEAAQAQTELAKGGVSLANILSGGLNASLSLAAAGEMELADAAATTANALNLFKLRGQEAGHVADVLATAANATTADVSDFALALTQGGAAAKAAGLDLDDTVVALETLALAGVKGSDAGTSLKAMLSQLAAPTHAQEVVMGELNLRFFDAEGKMKSLESISKMLGDRFKGLTKEQQLHAVKTIAGTDGMRALLALFDAGPEKIAKLEQGLSKQGTAAEVAAKKQDNLKGQIEQLRGSMETLAIGVGEKLIPILTSAAGSATEFVNQLQTGDGVGGRVAATISGLVGTVGDLAAGFNEGATDARLLAAGLGAAAAGFAAFKVVSGVIAGVEALTAAWGTMTAAMAKHPIGALAIGITAVVGALGVLSFRTKEASISSKDFTEALRAQRDALREVRDIDIDTAQRRANVKSATVAVEQAEKRLHDVRKDSSASALDVKQAEADLEQTRVSQKRANRELARSEEDQADKKNVAREATRKLNEEEKNLNSTVQDQIEDRRREVRGIDDSIEAVKQQGGEYKTIQRTVEALRDRQRELRNEINRLESKKVSVDVDFKLSPASGSSWGSSGDGWGRPIKGSLTKLAQGAMNAGKLFGAGTLGGFGGGGGGLMGARPGMAPFAGLGARFGLGVSSGARPGSITSAGNQSWHSTGEALDVSGDAGGMLAYARAVASMFGGRLAELIHTPLGFSIKNGQRVSPYAQADHFDHVHIAMDLGAPGQGDGWGRGGPRKPGTGDGIGQAASAAYGAGFRGMGLVNAVAIAGAESRYDAQAQNLKYPDHSIGMWQINQLAHRGRYGSDKQLKNPFTNARAAFAISGGGKNFGPWSTWPSAARSYLKRAQAAVAGLSGEKWGPWFGKNGKGSGGGGGGAVLESNTKRGAAFGIRTPGGFRAGGAFPSIKPPSGQKFEDKSIGFDIADAQADATEDTGDDLAALRGRKKAIRARLKQINKALRTGGLSKAQRRTLRQEKARLLGEINGVRGEIEDITSPDGAGGGSDPAVERNNELIAQQNDLIAQQNALLATETENQAKLIRLAESQPNQMLNALISAVNGGIGGMAGLGFETPSFAGGLARY